MEATLESVDKAKEMLLDLARDKMKSGGFLRGEIKTMFELVSSETGLSPDTIKNYYYRETVKEIEKVNQDNVNEPQVEEPKQEEVKLEVDKVEEKDVLASSLKSPVLRPMFPPYKPNTEIGVEVLEIRPTYALLKTMDGYDYNGILHISEIKDAYVDNINDYLREGMLLTVKVKTVQKDGRIEFSTRNMKLPLYNKKSPAPQKQSVEEKLTAIKEQLFKDEPGVITLPNNTDVKQIDQPKLYTELEEKKTMHQINPMITTYITKMVGALSPKGKDKLQEIVGSYSEFEIGVALSKLEDSFEVDLGVLLLQEVERKIGDGL